MNTSLRKLSPILFCRPISISTKKRSDNPPRPVYVWFVNELDSYGVLFFFVSRNRFAVRTRRIQRIEAIWTGVSTSLPFRSIHCPVGHRDASCVHLRIAPFIAENSRWGPIHLFFFFFFDQRNGNSISISTLLCPTHGILYRCSILSCHLLTMWWSVQC